MVNAGALRAGLAGIMTATGTSPAAGWPASRQGTLQAYTLRVQACSLGRRMTASGLLPRPTHSIRRHMRAIAAVTWIEILFTQGTATFEAFTGEISKGDVVRPASCGTGRAIFTNHC